MLRSVLVPIDLSRDAVLDNLLSAALDYAGRHDAAIHLLMVIPALDSMPLPHVDDHTIDRVVDDAPQRLEQVGTERIGKAHEWRADAITGRVASSIIRTADERAVALIVMTSHNPLFSAVFFGSVAAKVVRNANRSVRTVRQPKKPS